MSVITLLLVIGAVAAVCILVTAAAIALGMASKRADEVECGITQEVSDREQADWLDSYNKR